MDIGIITTSRADFGIYKPLLNELSRSNNNLFLFVGGMHVSKQHGLTYKSIEADFQVILLEDTLEPKDDPQSIGISMGNTLTSYASVLAAWKDKLDFLFVLGDRFEMFSAAASAVPFNFKLAHIHGGEVSKGAIDNKFRYAISALADIHFVSSDIHAQNLKSNHLSNIFNVGSLGVEAALEAKPIDQIEFEKRYNVSIQDGFILFTFHPETLDLKNEQFIREIIAALKLIPEKVLCTLPNADTQSSEVRKALLAYEEEFRDQIACHENLGQIAYYSAMAYCKLMIGNTSSGLIESTAFGTPVVNVGNRQLGRQHGNNVIHANNNCQDILLAYKKASTLESANDTPFGTGNSAKRIVEILEDLK